MLTPHLLGPAPRRVDANPCGTDLAGWGPRVQSVQGVHHLRVARLCSPSLQPFFVCTASNHHNHQSAIASGTSSIRWQVLEVPFAQDQISHIHRYNGCPGHAVQAGQCPASRVARPSTRPRRHSS